MPRFRPPFKSELVLVAVLALTVPAQAGDAAGSWSESGGEGATLYLRVLDDDEYHGALVLAGGEAAEVEALVDEGFLEGMIDGETGTALFEGHLEGDTLRLELADIDPATFQVRQETARTLTFTRTGPAPPAGEIEQIVAGAWEHMGLDDGPLHLHGTAPDVPDDGRHRPAELVRTWRASSTAGSTGGGGSVWATDREEVTLLADGRLSYTAGTAVSAQVPGVSGHAGPGASVLTGQWWVDGGMIVVQWDHGEVTRFEFNLFVHTDGLPALRVNLPGGQPTYFR